MSAFDADLALQKAIYARLSGDAPLAALVAGRIYDNVPADAGFPYMTLGEAQVSDWSTGDSEGGEHRLTFHVYSRGGGRAETKTILGAINAALHDAGLTPEGARLVGMRFLDAETRREPDGITWRGTIRLRALTEITE
ncbi:DUF3168 domain-containing protein [Parvibaculum sedimenti]|uniref:DUF3168 domain-containing protein n=1 Tax=Parvibaculum sedimenti TaxID=2608632 RepID=A0A6N6VK65_9HYPH|nr:DUF3168 domain-containing protein [Parvibaculum sedimenti]KAB7741603.1 DUF3168 domain-containing protein [Parvibaculum sedimenti]